MMLYVQRILPNFIHARQMTWRIQDFISYSVSFVNLMGVIHKRESIKL